MSVHPRRRVGFAAFFLMLACPLLAAADAAPDPAWVAEVVGAYGGTVRNEGATECQRTELTLQDGHLIGHYWIDAKDPLEGTMTDFVAESGTSGHFTWHDRYGSGIEVLVFAADRNGFVGLWGGDQVDPRNAVYGTRGGTAQCAHAVS